MKGQRLDVALHEQGFAPSRERARALIMAGIVYINDVKAEKAGEPLPADAIIEVRGRDIAYVSRGGLKLEKALQVFPTSPNGKICMDVGSSTGGFTDCMLQNGATKVYAVDVGYGQLDWKLRSDERVVSMERTNIRHLTPEEVPDKIDFFSVDVSFISLKHVFPAMSMLVSDGAEGVCLVKPQFEAGREKVGKKGVVRETETHIEVLVQAQANALQFGFNVLGLDYSPIRGPEGNIEFLLFVAQSTSPESLPAERVIEVVQQAHTAFGSTK